MILTRILKLFKSDLRLFAIHCRYGDGFRYGKRIVLSHDVSIHCSGRIMFGDRMAVQVNTHLSSVSGGILRIGKHVSINRGCIIVARKQIEIGDDCMLGPNVCIYDHDHCYTKDGITPEIFKTGSVIIGKRCWIGANTVILRGTVLGDGCVVGAGAVIKGEYAAHSLIYSKNDVVTKPIY